MSCLGIGDSLRRTTETLEPSVLSAPPNRTLPFLNITPLDAGGRTLTRYPTKADPFVLPLFTSARMALGCIPSRMFPSVCILGNLPITLATLRTHLRSIVPYFTTPPDPGKGYCPNAFPSSIARPPATRHTAWGNRPEWHLVNTVSSTGPTTCITADRSVSD